MICKNCGSEVPEGFAFCTNCGAPASDPQPTVETVNAPEAEVTPISSFSDADVAFSEIPQKSHSKVMGIIALILGIVALIYPAYYLISSCCSFIPLINYIVLLLNLVVGTVFFVASPVSGIVGLILGILSRKSAKAHGCKDSLGTIGMILSIVGLAAFVLAIVIGLIFILLGFGAGIGLGCLSSIAESSTPSYYGGGYY